MLAHIHMKGKYQMSRIKPGQLNDERLVRVPVQLTLKQDIELGVIAENKKWPKSILIREGVDLIIKKYQDK